MKNISKKTLQALLDLIPTPIAWKNEKGVVCGSNKAFKTHPPSSSSLPTKHTLSLFDDADQHIGTLEMLPDSTQTKKEDLHILNTSPSNIYWKNLNGHYVGSNETHTEFVLKRTKKKHRLIGKTDYDFYEKEIADKITANDKQVIESGKTITFEEPVRLPDGSLATFISKKAPWRDANGNIIGVISSSIDITKQKTLETALISAKETAEKNKLTTEIYLESILANLPDHVFWEDQNGIFLGCNDQQAKSFGYKKGTDVIGKSIDELGANIGWSQKTIKRIKENDMQVMQGAQTITLEEYVNWADKKSRVFLSRKAPLHDKQGNCIGMLGMAFDITERKEMEEKLREAKIKAETANVAKSHFVANISHDLRTPLHTILGTAELMQVHEHFPEQDELIEAILQAGQELLKLVEKVLNFSEAAASGTSTDRFDLRHAVEAMVANYTKRAEEKQIDLIISYSDFVPHYVISDLHSIQRIIGNLLENAIKFTEKGYIMVAVESSSIKNDVASLQISVEDSGIGISKTDLAHIFDRFYRLAPSYVGHCKGMGLGLSIVKQLTDQLNGTLSVNSQAGKGTTFSCTLPFKLTESLIDEETLRRQFHQTHILIVDDLLQRRESLLKQLPGQNVAARSSKDALRYFKTKESEKTPCNLIIIDEDITTHSPENLAQLFRDESSLPQSPLMVLCRKDGNHSPTQEQKKLFSEILKKPLAPSELATHIVPAWQRWLAAYRRKTHKPLKQKINVLLVEDDPLIQKFTYRLLIDCGCHVDVASDGKTALKKAKNDYDLVLMDIGLPDIDGLTATREFREKVKDRKKKPIIVALTAHVSNEDKERCLAAGLDAFLTKPATYYDFQQLLKKFFKAERN